MCGCLCERECERDREREIVCKRRKTAANSFLITQKGNGKRETKRAGESERYNESKLEKERERQREGEIEKERDRERETK